MNLFNENNFDRPKRYQQISSNNKPSPDILFLLDESSCEHKFTGKQATKCELVEYWLGSKHVRNMNTCEHVICV